MRGVVRGVVRGLVRGLVRGVVRDVVRGVVKGVGAQRGQIGVMSEGGVQWSEHTLPLVPW